MQDKEAEEYEGSNNGLIDCISLVTTGIELRRKGTKETTIALLNSKSSGNFLSQDYGTKNKIKDPKMEHRFRVANQTQVFTTSMIPEYGLCIEDQEFYKPMHILPRLTHDMILGIPWFEKHDPRISFKTIIVGI